MMNVTAKQVGKMMMLVGGCIFSGGAGICIADDMWNNMKRNAAHKDALRASEKSHEEELFLINKKKSLSEIESNEIYKDRLKNMDQDAFAKYQAERVSTANAETIARAREIETNAKSDLAKAKLECSEKIAKVQADCVAKIEAAEKRAEEAVKKYEAINDLFENKDEILEIKAEFENMAKKSAAAKEQEAELANKISILIGKDA